MTLKKSPNLLLEELGAQWLKYHRSIDESGKVNVTLTEQEDFIVTATKIEELIKQSPIDGWNLIQIIYLDCNTNVLKACLAAGLLEDFLVFHGSYALEKIKLTIQNDSSFNELLDGVWQGAIKDDTWARLQEFRAE